MSYAGVERVYPKRCRPSEHDWLPRGDCHVCGVYRDDLVREAEETLRIFKPAPQGPADHVYTVDVILHGVESSPCVICGLGRRAHEPAPQED